MKTQSVVRPANTSSDPLRDAAEFATLTALLNCYIREFARPARQIAIRTEGNVPQALLTEFLSGEVITIVLSASERLMAIRADRRSLLDRCRFNSAVFIKEYAKPWRILSAMDSIALLHQEMAAQLQQPINPELSEQTENSIQVTQMFFENIPPPRPDNFIRSEQSLFWGHPFHPTPKSRSGVARKALLACSPETGASFPLYWFRIDASLLQWQGDFRVVRMLSALSGNNHSYPCHPWEVPHIVASPLYRQAQRQGLITPLGPRGPQFFPTSSVRTFYLPELPWFLKCSIHVRLTNCVRKNSWYELESAVALNRLLNDAFSRLEVITPGFSIMREPAATSLDFSAVEGATTGEVRHLQECFGILYRTNFPFGTLADYQIELAAALFSWGRLEECSIQLVISHLAHARQLAHGEACHLWFTAYLDLLLPSVLEAFFTEGIVFEPHLQNILIGMQENLPVRIWIRDLEGTKLLSERWPSASLSDMSQRAKESVWYSRSQGWQRIAYCLLVNNLSEAIFYLADGDRKIEQQLWRVLSQRLVRWQQQPEVSAILKGEPLPSKNNLRTRLLKDADRQASYTYISHPLRDPA